MEVHFCKKRGEDKHGRARVRGGNTSRPAYPVFVMIIDDNEKEIRYDRTRALVRNVKPIEKDL